jgi:hemolysin activation/secretion protein
VEISRQAHDTFFGPFSVLRGAVSVYQLYGDWSNRWSDPFGATALNVSVHGSPGGVDAGNSSAAFADFTNGRVIRADYVYGALSLTRQTRLPLGFNLTTQVDGQYAGQAIPDSQQIALGGQTAVRGYTLDDGAWDDGVVLRNALNSPVVQIARTGPFSPTFTGRVFADYGFGRNEAARFSVNVASVGLGADVRVRTNAVASADVSWPLIDARYTRAGDAHLDARLTLAY